MLPNKRLAALLAATALCAAAAFGQKPSPESTSTARPEQQQPRPEPGEDNLLTTPASYAYILDGDTGQELYSWHGHQAMVPASMSKLMLYYVVFERLKDKTLKLEDTFEVSEHAWRTGGAMAGGTAAKSDVSTMFLDLHSKVSVEDLLKGAIIVSGNDACIVLAEGLFGSEEAAARKMTERAKELGLENSSFTNATGLDDPGQRMTAADIAKLSHRIIRDFPEYYKIFSTTEFTWNKHTQANRNPLLTELPGSDGVKTGHLSISGYGLVGSSVADGKRRIIVLNGLPTMADRKSESRRVMMAAFRDFKTVNVVKKGVEVGAADVWLGEDKSVPLVTTDDVSLGLHIDAAKKIKATVVYEGPLSAPVKAGDIVGKLVINAPGREPIEVKVAAGKSVSKLNFFALAMRGLTGDGD
jgi:D-alanyl-D-alanine carboxypeptidase (penicillin-binding protein 5/6)